MARLEGYMTAKALALALEAPPGATSLAPT